MRMEGDEEEGAGARPFAEINVTPFVDVMLVLLIIFMVAAPMMTSGVPVDLPRTAAAPLAPPEPPIELAVTGGGRLVLGRGEEVSEAGLPARLAALRAEAPERALHLRADRALPYGEVLRVMALVQASGVRRVALVSRPEEGGR